MRVPQYEVAHDDPVAAVKRAFVSYFKALVLTTTEVVRDELIQTGSKHASRCQMKFRHEIGKSGADPRQGKVGPATTGLPFRPREDQSHRYGNGLLVGATANIGQIADEGGCVLRDVALHRSLCTDAHEDDATVVDVAQGLAPSANAHGQHGHQYSHRAGHTQY